MPKASVIIPVFNGAATVRRAVESVLRQTVDDLEVVVVDDGSIDETPLILSELAKSDSRVTIYRKANRGVSAALNDGLDRSTSDYVSMLGSDDLWLPTYLEVMADVLDADPALAVAYSAAWWVAAGRVPRVQRRDVMTRNLPPEGPPSTASALLEQLLIRGNFIPVSALIRRATVEGVGRFDTRLRYGEDYELWLRLAAHGHTAAYIPKRLWIKRVREDALSWDARTALQGWRDVCDIVAGEYDIPDSVRELARTRSASCGRELAAMWRTTQPSLLARLRPIAGSLKRALLWWRWYYIRPPREFRELPADLRGT